MKKIELGHELTQYFQEEIQSTARKQGKTLAPHTTEYLSHLLSKFAYANNYALSNLKGPQQNSPMATMWLEGLQAGTHQQYECMIKLGDFALFTSGFFADQIQGSALDMDYYIAMGGNAYKRAGQIQESIRAEKALNVFFELAQGFEGHMELLNELSIRSQLFNEKDLLRLYEKWTTNGSGNIERILNEKGIIPQKAKPGIS